MHGLLENKPPPASLSPQSIAEFMTTRRNTALPWPMPPMPVGGAFGLTAADVAGGDRPTPTLASRRTRRPGSARSTTTPRGRAASGLA